MKNKDRDFLTRCAVRYCLGRQSYIVSTMTDYLIKHAEEINKADLRAIIKDIEDQEINGYGDSMCKHEWMRALAALKASQVKTSIIRIGEKRK